MKFIYLNCKKCGGDTSIKVDNNIKIIYCPYCKEKCLIDDETRTINKNIHYRKEDVARMIESENKLKIKQMELANKDKEHKNEIKKTIGAVFLFLFILLLFLILGLTGIID